VKDCTVSQVILVDFKLSCLGPVALLISRLYMASLVLRSVPRRFISTYLGDGLKELWFGHDELCDEKLSRFGFDDRAVDATLVYSLGVIALTMNRF
jgi:hypothetical protein